MTIIEVMVCYYVVYAFFVFVFSTLRKKILHCRNKVQVACIYPQNDFSIGVVECGEHASIMSGANNGYKKLVYFSMIWSPRAKSSYSFNYFWKCMCILWVTGRRGGAPEIYKFQPVVAEGLICIWNQICRFLMQWSLPHATLLPMGLHAFALYSNLTYIATNLFMFALFQPYINIEVALTEQTCI